MRASSRDICNHCRGLEGGARIPARKLTHAWVHRGEDGEKGGTYSPSCIFSLSPPIHTRILKTRRLLSSDYVEVWRYASLSSVHSHTLTFHTYTCTHSLFIITLTHTHFAYLHLHTLTFHNYTHTHSLFILTLAHNHFS